MFDGRGWRVRLGVRPRFRALIAGVAAVVLVGGCGGGSKPTTTVNVAPPAGTSGFAAIAPAVARANAAALPPRIQPVFPNPLPGEGVWKRTGPRVDGGPPVLVATYRPDLGSPDTFAYVAWFDHTRTELAYYPGGSEPPSAAVRGPTMVPQEPALAAACDLQRGVHRHRRQ